MNVEKKNILIFISIFLVLLLVTGGTYAYWIWNSEENKNVVFNSIGEVEDYVVYDEGLSYFIGNFQPYDSFCQSVSTTLSFYKTRDAYESDLTATIYMDVNSIGENISASNDVYWIVTSGDNSISCGDGFSSSSVINYGTFNGTRDGDTITLVKNLQVGTVKQEFTVWIWIDSADSDLSILSGETVDTNVWTQIDMYSNNSEVPRLDYGMIPVTIANNGTVTTISASNGSWYDYSHKKWANAILVTQSSRSTYMNTSGVVVNPADILAYYVWIPRYKYRIPGIKCSTLENPTIEEYPECYAPYTVSDEDRTELIKYLDARYFCGMGSNDLEFSTAFIDEAIQNGVSSENVTINTVFSAYNSGETVCASNPFTPKESGVSYEAGEFNGDNYLFVESTVDVLFEGASLPLTLGDAKTSYRTHPAFWWDNDSDGVVDNGELVAGIWVGKFESTGTGDYPTILPNVTSLRNQNQATQFATSLKFGNSSNIYGLSNGIVDSHMMKNTEWGVVAYLSHSLYGIQNNVRVNNNTNFITGCGALEDYASGVASCEIVYGSGVTSYPQSTTGNITGVFDMSGGASEIMMAIYEGTIETGVTAFPTIPDSKYYNEYNSVSSDVACNGDKCYGHALFEVLGWYDAFGATLNSQFSWSNRGGKSTNVKTLQNTLFSAYPVYYGNNVGSSESTWRSVIVMGHDS